MIETKTKSPKFFFQIIKKQQHPKPNNERIISNPNHENYIMKELIRLSYNPVTGIFLLTLDNILMRNKRTKYKMFGAELKRKFIDIVNN